MTPAERDREILGTLKKNESWWRSIVHAVKETVFGVSIMVALNEFVFDEPVFNAQFYALWGSVTFGRSILERRRGRFSASSLLVTGGVLAGTGALLLGGALFVGDKMLPLLAIPTLAIGGLTLWAGRGARREEERHDAQLADAAPAPGAITRREFDRRMETMRLATKGQMPWVIAAFVAAIGGTISIAVLGERFDWPEWTGAAGFAWFWAGIGGLTWWGARTSKRISKEFELECPACARPFYGAFISSRAQTLLDTLGRCPRCAARVIVEDY